MYIKCTLLAEKGSKSVHYPHYVVVATRSKHSMSAVVIVDLDLASGTRLFISRQRTNILEFEPICNQPKQTKTEKEKDDVRTGHVVVRRPSSIFTSLLFLYSCAGKYLTQ